ncbi:MAG TPA: class I SAM-dependent methyltransferase [Candidatus Paceibacterota bacterium]
MNTLILLKQFDWQGKKVLDMGVGSGQLSLPLAEGGAIVTTIDKDESAMAKFSHPNITKVVTDIVTYNFEQGSFDIVIARNVLPFLGSRLFEIFEQIVNTTRKGGIIFCSFFGERDEWRSKPNIKCLSENEIIELLKKHNLKIHYQEIEEGIAPTMAGPTKYWHVLSYLLIK